MTAADNPLDLARTVLEPGERLVWAGRPGPAAQPAWRLDRTSLLLAAVPLCVGLVLLWQALAAPAVPEDLFYLGGGLVLLCVALSPLATLWRASRRVRDTVYAVTDRRLLILAGGPRRRPRAFAPEDLEEPRVQDRGDGRGDVIFGTLAELRQTRQGRQTRLAPAAFTDIEDAQRVALEIARLRERAQAAEVDA
ncbi:MAG TPA: hypothetical protein VKP12_12100 [Kiloniellaceae bacterium]|nr:hypothetical protein [Kiloniellaceae bacterium]